MHYLLVKTQKVAQLAAVKEGRLTYLVAIKARLHADLAAACAQSRILHSGCQHKVLNFRFYKLT